MNQFTSNFDFSLTKKRFLMMSSKRSAKREKVIRFSLIPLFAVIIFSFCSYQLQEEVFKSIDLVSGIDGRIYKANPILYTKDGESYFHTKHSTYPFLLVFDDRHELFSGIQKFVDRQTKELSWEHVYEDGVLLSTTTLKDTLINARKVAYMKQTYPENGVVTKLEYNEENNLLYRREISETEVHTYGPDNELLDHTSVEEIDGDKWIFVKGWYPNGQLNFEFESTFGLHGITTMYSYDEEGKLLEKKVFGGGEN